jgi:hypothetical protein
MESNNTELLIGLALFVASELIGMSKFKSNSLLQLLLQAASRAFPYEISVAKTEEKPKKRRFLHPRDR